MVEFVPAKTPPLDEARASALIKSKIETFALEQGKHVVEERIAVGKLHLAADWNHQKRRLKAFVLLYQLRDLRGFLSRWLDGGSHRRQP